MTPIQPLVAATGPSPSHGPGSPFPLQAGTTEAAAAIRPLDLLLNLSTPACPRTGPSGPAAATPRRAHGTRPTRPIPELPGVRPSAIRRCRAALHRPCRPRGGRHTGPCGIACPSSSAARARTGRTGCPGPCIKKCHGRPSLQSGPRRGARRRPGLRNPPPAAPNNTPRIPTPKAIPCRQTGLPDSRGSPQPRPESPDGPRCRAASRLSGPRAGPN